MRVCVQCGGALVDATEEIQTRVDDLLFLIEAPAQQCVNCKETYISGAVHERLDLLVANQLSKSGILSGSIFRFMRKSLGIRANDLAQLLGVSPETVSRWETGKRDVDRASFAAVGAMISDALGGRADTVERLRSLVEPKRPGPVTKLGRLYLAS